MSQPVLLFYCQHSLGLGHLARSLRIAEGLTERFDVVLLNGGRFPTGSTVPAGVTVVNLPPLGHDERYRLVSHDPALSVDQASELRRQMILDTLHRTAPVVVLIEMYPFGRKKFEFELVPLLDAVLAMGSRRPRIVCSLRDILVNQRRDQAQFDERVSQRANRYFDAILVHADPAFARLDESFTPATPLQVPVHYTGFVAPPAPEPASTVQRKARRLLVSSGGGMVGEPLVRAAVEAHEDLLARTGLTTTVVAGPFLPEPVWRWLQGKAAESPALTAVRQVPDLCREMQLSAVSLSQCGYNTTMDVLRARTPAVVVPFSEGTEDEQSRRAERLAALGVVRVIPPAEVTGERVVTEVSAAAMAAPAPISLDLSGAMATASTVAAIAGLQTVEYA